MASQETSQQQSGDMLAKNEAPELRRGFSVPRDRYLAHDLPPLHRLEDIFADMASKALELGFWAVLFQLGGRPLRMATMCSGTEAPLLALELIQNSKLITIFYFLRQMWSRGCERLALPRRDEGRRLDWFR